VAVEIKADDQLSMLDRTCSVSTLGRVLLRKIRRKTLGLPLRIEPAYRFGPLVFDRPELDGGGAGFGQDYLRVLHDLGIGQRERAFEFCAGPGYIGYSLLGHAWCRSLALADVNPVAVEAARQTARFNRLDDRVDVYLSNVLADVPVNEKWDLVVGNPPHFLKWPGRTQLRCEDEGWQIHARFYATLKPFLGPGAVVLIQENALGSSADVFRPMIESGGGRVVASIPGPDIGDGGTMYYVQSKWD
jgi:hypothetical protein